MDRRSIPDTIPGHVQGALQRFMLGWPPDLPLAVLTWRGGGVGGGAAEGEGGWSFVAAPRRALRFVAGEGGGRSEWVDSASGEPLEPPVPLVHDPLADLERMLAWGQAEQAQSAGGARAGAVPRPEGAVFPHRAEFKGGWVGVFGYELGRIIEPRACTRAWRRGDVTVLELQYCPEGLLIDHASGRTEWVGEESHRPELRDVPGKPLTIGEPDVSAGQSWYTEGVARVLEHIAAGDVYQVNLAHRLSMLFSGSTREAFVRLERIARPWYGAYLELAPGLEQRRQRVLSLSPELFLEVEPGPEGVRITTRPMKGTRPASGDPHELRDNPKDRAELTMIVDLMRNDLGRICRAGSVRVPQLRAIERHGPRNGGVLQATATVMGVLREGVGMAEILRATFPPGSVTGAPKIRAMQIIDELEPVARGPYCGSIGWIGFDGRASLNVGIRTGVVEDNRLHYSVGAGIVADSMPDAEWRETLDKAGILRAVMVPVEHAEGGEVRSNAAARVGDR